MTVLETPIWIAIVAGVTLIIISLLGFLLLRTSKRHDKRDEPEIEPMLSAPSKGDLEAEKVDNAADAAIDEINKTARLVLDEIEDKYQSMLFLYNLLEEKRRELTVLPESKPQAMLNTPAAVRRQNVQSMSDSTLGHSVRPRPQRAARVNKENERHRQVKDLFHSGQTVQEIAKLLNMGQGEVQLILELAGR